MGVGLVAASHFAVVWFITANNGATEIVEFITRKIAVIDILKRLCTHEVEPIRSQKLKS